MKNINCIDVRNVCMYACLIILHIDGRTKIFEKFCRWMQHVLR